MNWEPPEGPTLALLDLVGLVVILAAIGAAVIIPLGSGFGWW